MKRFIDKGRVVAKKRLNSIIELVFGSIKPAYIPQTCFNFNGTINDASGKSWNNNGGVSISSTQSRSGGNSAYFNGSSYLISYDYYQIGQCDFTLEAWVYPTTENVSRTIFDGRPSSGVMGAYPFLNINSTNKLEYYSNYGFTPNVTLTSISSIPTNQWTHVAYCREKGVGYLFVNGYLESTVADTVIYTQTQMSVGKTTHTTNHYFFTGYMDEVLIYKWIGKYKENFIPQNSNLFHSVGFNTPKPKGNFQLASLLHFYGEDTSNSFADVTMKTWGVVNAIISTSRSKNGYPSGYFNGTNAYITTTPHTDFDLGTGDFTIESHVFIDGDSPLLSNEKTATIMQNSSHGSSKVIGGMSLYIYGDTVTTGTGIGFWIWNGNNWDKIENTNFSFNKQQWYHVAVCRVSGITTIYVDGVAVASGSQTRSIVNSFNLTVGASVASGYEWYLKGFLSDFRIVKGTALYTSTFTPPTEVLPDLGNNIFGEVTNKGWTNVGGVQINTDNSLFDKACMYFNGSSYLEHGASSDFDLGSHDFSVEFWMYPISLPSTWGRLIMLGSNGSTNSMQCYIDSTGGFLFGRALENARYVGEGAIVSAGKWQHVMLCVKGTNAYLFIDGVLKASNPIFQKPSGGSTNLRIGKDTAAGQNYNGYLQDFRIIKGTALYTSDFPKPTKSCWD